MNRRTALLLALAALLAHVLAIHHDSARNFAGAYDEAHVAYHVAERFAASGTLSWQEGSYSGAPRILWWLILSGATSVGLPILPVGQLLGLIATLATVALSSRFVTDRIAGIVSPVLLVFSSGFAAMAASGTDGPLFALLAVATFHAHQRGYAKRFATSLTLFTLARPEAVALGLGFLGLSLWRRLQGRGILPLWTYTPAALLAAVLFLLPDPGGSSWYGSWWLSLWPEAPEWGRPVDQGWTFLLTAVTPLLLAFPLIEWILQRLSGIGRHATGLSLLWLVIATLERKTSTLHYFPILPVLFIAVQQGMILALDSGRRFGIGISWGSLLTSVLFAALISKYPGNLGPVPFESLHRAWMETNETVPLGTRPVAGRMAVEQEVRIADRMRTLANFLGRNGLPDEHVLSAWPGALAHLSGLRVDDLTGRVGDAPRCASVLELLQRHPAFIVPGQLSQGLLSGTGLSTRVSRALASFDPELSPKLVRQVAVELEQYWILSLPISSDPRRLRRPYHLLARRDLGLCPSLEWQQEGSRFQVKISEPSAIRLPLMADLVITLRMGERELWLDPAGTTSEEGSCRARCGLLIVPQDHGPVALWQGELPYGVAEEVTQLAAQLVTPGSSTPGRLQRIGEEAVLTLPR